MPTTLAPQRMRLVDPQRDLEEREAREEFRHRMKVNCAAAAAIIALLTLGIWLADAMVEAQRAQGCYASGFHSCSLI